MRQTATQPIRSIGFSLAIGRHFLIATLPGTNELPINMDGWNTSLSEKGFQFFFRGKLLVSAREKKHLSTSQNRTWLPNIMCNWIDYNTYNTSSKGTKKISTLQNYVLNTSFVSSCFTHYQDYQLWNNPSPAIPCDLRPCRWVSITSESWTWCAWRVSENWSLRENLVSVTTGHRELKGGFF